ncbi:Aspartyl/asparaginyl beta-hydroxylase [Apodemus speciosus]|uniref:Aspartyl/asparaginyl beta-hydroxylase n=1 Tax=Apodemus speciosus TaxID=105296 RepID=A0ABQ0EN10_APOSI
MAPRKNAKGGGGNSSSSGSGSGSGSPSTGSSGSSSSPGARRGGKARRTQERAERRDFRRSFFTWVMVIALLGVWTSVAVVWFDLVDYEEVLGKLGVYDADGDGDFDVDDAKVLLGERPCLTKDGSNENIDSLEEVLTILAEESSDWFYGFLSFLYDIMTPFEMLEEEEEESETADDVDGLKERSTSERTFPLGTEVQNVEDEVREQIQSLLQESVHTDHDLEADESAGEPQPEVEDFLTVTDRDDRFEDLEPGTVHEVVSLCSPDCPGTHSVDQAGLGLRNPPASASQVLGLKDARTKIEDSYHMEETASQNHPNDVEEMMSEQENSDHSEAGTDADTLQQDPEEVRHQDYDEPVYEPSENEGIEVSDNAIDDSSVISEEINVVSVEEQQDTPPVLPPLPQEDQTNHTLQKMAVIDLVM